MIVQTACHRAAIVAKGKIRPTIAASLQERRFKSFCDRIELQRTMRGNPYYPRIAAYVWLSISIEDIAAMMRLWHLKKANASMCFVTFEPLLGPINGVDLEGIHWVIVRGESGPGARAMEAEWARSLSDQCREQRVAFFFKQWGGRTPKAGGNTLDGCQWQEYADMVYDRVLETPLQAAGAPVDGTYEQS